MRKSNNTRGARAFLPEITGLETRATRSNSRMTGRKTRPTRTLADRRRGFTLAEIIVVVVIMAIIVSVTAPNFAGSLQKYQMNRAGSDLLMLLRYARQRAVVTQEPRRVVVDLDRGCYWVWESRQESERNYRKRRYEDEKLVQGHRNDVPEGYVIRGVYKTYTEDLFTSGQVELHFYPDGTGEGARIIVERLATDRHAAARSGIRIESFNANPKYMDPEEVQQTFGT